MQELLGSTFLTNDRIDGFTMGYVILIFVCLLHIVYFSIELDSINILILR